jgi:hypothetical protein
VLGGTAEGEEGCGRVGSERPMERLKPAARADGHNPFPPRQTSRRNQRPFLTLSFFSG